MATGIIHRFDDLNYPDPPSPKIDTTTFTLPKNQYVNMPSKKKGITLHHTVSGTVKSVYNWWIEKGDRKRVRVGTSYVIGKDGIIYQFFPDEYWAWHLGKGIDTSYEKKFIGIELVSWGPCLPAGSGYRPVVTKNIKLGPDEVGDIGGSWRGYRYFDLYSDKQISSTISLLHYLCDKHDIPKIINRNIMDYNRSLLDLPGIITHAQVRPDKTDVHPLFPTDYVAKWVGLDYRKS